MMLKSNSNPLYEDQAPVQLIIFCAGHDEFGILISEVQEIIKLSDITPIPNSSDFVKGIINVRGKIVTAIDVKARFSLIRDKNIESKHIIVTKHADYLFGLIVDEVLEILRIQKKDLNPPPSLVAHTNAQYVSGIVSHEGRLIVVLNLAALFSQQELVNLRSISREPSEASHFTNQAY